MYIYPDNLKSKASMWLWELKDLAVTGIIVLVSVHLRGVRKNLPAAENLHRETILKNHLDVQRTCGG